MKFILYWGDKAMIDIHSHILCGVDDGCIQGLHEHGAGNDNQNAVKFHRVPA